MRASSPIEGGAFTCLPSRPWAAPAPAGPRADGPALATPLRRAPDELEYGPPRPRRRRAPWPREDTIEKLTSKQRAFLKSRAHSLKAIHQIGREGVTDGTVQTVTESLGMRELLKVKVLDGAPASARETGEALVERIPGAQLVQVIGRTVVVYRPHPEKPEIRLP